MTKSKKQLHLKLDALKEELSKREKIAALLESEGLRLAVADYKEKLNEAVLNENKKEIASYQKSLALLIDFKGFLNTQQERAERIPELIYEIECELQQGNLFD